MLYSEITSLSTKEGYCYASNKYFAELYEVELETISRLISSLENNGYIERKILYKDGTKEIEKRILIPIDNKINTYCQKNQEGYCDFSQGGIDKKVKDNNTSNNTTSINNIYIDDIELNELFNEFLKQRKKQKAINSERAINELLNKLRPYDKETQKEMINNALVNSWKSVYPLKNKPQIKESVPEWFNQEIKKEETKDINAIKEMEELLKEYR